MKKYLLIAVLPVVFILAGCGTTAKFVYPSNMKNLTVLSEDPLYNKSVAVMPFDDFRTDNNSFSPMFLYLIPLSPYGYVEYDRPDAAKMFLTIQEFQMDVSEDLAKATALSLRQSNLFHDSYFTFGGEKDKADYYVTGEVNILYYRGKQYTYGLSIEGPLLWFLGAPIGTSLNTINVTLYLHKRDSKKVLWKYTIDKEDYYMIWLYHRMGWDTRLFAKLYEDGMNEAIHNLAQSIKDNPKKFE